MFLSKNWYFSVQTALIYYTVNKSHHNSFILLVFSHVANFRYVANFRFLTLQIERGCRQGDPIVPYLFLLVAEVLGCLIEKSSDIRGILKLVLICISLHNLRMILL